MQCVGRCRKNFRVFGVWRQYCLTNKDSAPNAGGRGSSQQGRPASPPVTTVMTRIPTPSSTRSWPTAMDPRTLRQFRRDQPMAAPTGSVPRRTRRLLGSSTAGEGRRSSRRPVSPTAGSRRPTATVTSTEAALHRSSARPPRCPRPPTVCMCRRTPHLQAQGCRPRAHSSARTAAAPAAVRGLSAPNRREASTRLSWRL